MHFIQEVLQKDPAEMTYEDVDVISQFTLLINEEILKFAVNNLKVRDAMIDAMELAGEFYEKLLTMDEIPEPLMYAVSNPEFVGEIYDLKKWFSIIDDKRADKANKAFMRMLSANEKCFHKIEGPGRFKKFAVCDTNFLAGCRMQFLYPTARYLRRLMSGVPIDIYDTSIDIQKKDMPSIYYSPYKKNYIIDFVQKHVNFPPEQFLFRTSSREIGIAKADYLLYAFGIPFVAIEKRDGEDYIFMLVSDKRKKDIINAVLSLDDEDVKNGNTQKTLFPEHRFFSAIGELLKDSRCVSECDRKRSGAEWTMSGANSESVSERI